MTRQISAESLKAQIEEMAPQWSDDLWWDQDEDGDVRLCWKKPVRLLMGGGVAVLEELLEPICSIGIDYPLSAAMRHRVKSYQTNIYAEVVAARVARKTAAQKETEAAEHELRQELLGAARGRLVFQVPRGG